MALLIPGLENEFLTKTFALGWLGFTAETELFVTKRGAERSEVVTWFTGYRLRIDGLQKLHQLSFVSGKQFQTAAKFGFTALAKLLFCLWGESSERLSQLTDLFSDVPASLPGVADRFEFQQEVTAAKGVSQHYHPGREVVATLEAADEPIGSGPGDFG